MAMRLPFLGSRGSTRSMSNQGHNSAEPSANFGSVVRWAIVLGIATAILLYFRPHLGMSSSGGLKLQVRGLSFFSQDEEAVDETPVPISSSSFEDDDGASDPLASDSAARNETTNESAAVDRNETPSDTSPVSNSTLGQSASPASQSPDKQETSKPSSVPEADNLVTVQVDRIELTSSPRVLRTYTGVLTPARSSDLGFRHPGRVQNVLVDQGQSVRAGDVIARLETESLDAEKKVLEAELRAGEAVLAELEAGPREQTIAAARATLQELQTSYDQQRSTYDRQTRLAQRDLGVTQDLEDARAGALAAEQRLEAQKQLVQELEEGTRSEQIQAQRAMVDRIKASLESLNVSLRQHELVAPYDGIVSRRLVDEGTVVAAGTVVLSIVQTAEPEAWVGLPANIAAHLVPGETHSLRMDDASLKATFVSALPQVDTATRTRTAIFRFDSLPDNAAFGQLVRWDQTRVESTQGMWVPNHALTHGVRGLWSVMIVGNVGEPAVDGTVVGTLERRDVEVLQIETDRVLVRGTIDAGEWVVVDGIQKLVSGQRVRAVCK